GLFYKDESKRFGLGSFKAAGAGYAVLRTARNLALNELDDRALWSGAGKEILDRFTVACASEGNHGHAVAWSAKQFGLRCVVMLPQHVVPERAARIESLGATVLREAGTYDEVVMALQRKAAEEEWIVISDTAYVGYDEVPRDIMRGYLTIFDEASE